jgi:hypothetical protein
MMAQPSLSTTVDTAIRKSTKIYSHSSAAVVKGKGNVRAYALLMNVSGQLHALSPLTPGCTDSWFIEGLLRYVVFNGRMTKERMWKEEVAACFKVYSYIVYSLSC